MNKQQSGFTLIELIMVIVVLGALAATALPRYVNLQAQADQAAVDGVAGALAAGSAINYAACVSGNTACLDSSTTPAVAACDDVAETLAGSAAPTGYAITPTTAYVATVGDTDTCTVTHTASGLTATFEAIAPD